MRNLNWSGVRHPSWKGGSRGWQAGKLGRDKDGLSWKVQRKLAWERDNYTCQDADGTCSPLRNGKPDCHHKVPYRLSFSHALDNLVSLCQHHHKKREAQIKELWGGHSLIPPMLFERVKICGCGRRFKGGCCRVCDRRKRIEEVLIPKAKELRKLGKTYVEIKKELGESLGMVWNWVNK